MLESTYLVTRLLNDGATIISKRTDTSETFYINDHRLSARCFIELGRTIELVDYNEEGDTFTYALRKSPY